jgi:hypothetical protein
MPNVTDFEDSALFAVFPALRTQTPIWSAGLGVVGVHANVLVAVQSCSMLQVVPLNSHHLNS